MNYKKAIAILALITLTLILGAIAFEKEIRPKTTPALAKVTIGTNEFFVEIAATPQQHQIGLMERTNLDRNMGMLFVYTTESMSSFWMKNTLIPLDIVWINRNLEIVDIKRNTPPCTTVPCEIYTTSSPGQYVLEVNSGITEELGINIGDKVAITYDSP